jgi:hypothetical protein
MESQIIKQFWGQIFVQREVWESSHINTFIYRCIHDDQRTFSLGIQWFIARLLGM